MESAYATAVRSLHEELIALWSRGGRKTAWQLAAHSGLPAARFEFLFRRPGAVPEFRDIEALLKAMGESSAVDNWRRRWKLAKELEHLPPAFPREEVDEDARELMDKALDAQSTDGFVVQLDNLRKLRNLSFNDIEKRSGKKLPRSTAHWMVRPGNFPARADQVRQFVRACDVLDEGDVADWVTAYARAAARRRIQATIQKSAARYVSSDPVAVLEEISDALVNNGSYSEAIKLLKDALTLQKSRVVTRERREPA